MVRVVDNSRNFAHCPGAERDHLGGQFSDMSPPMPAGLRVPGDINRQIIGDAAEIRLVNIDGDLYTIQLADQADDRSRLKIGAYFEIELIQRAGYGSEDSRAR